MIDQQLNEGDDIVASHALHLHSDRVMPEENRFRLEVGISLQYVDTHLKVIVTSHIPCKKIKMRRDRKSNTTKQV